MKKKKQKKKLILNCNNKIPYKFKKVIYSIDFLELIWYDCFKKGDFYEKRNYI